MIANVIFRCLCVYTHTHAHTYTHTRASLVKNSLPSSKEFTYNARNAGSIPESRSLLEKEMAIHSSILAWEIPWTEEPGRLLSMESQTVRHDLATKQQQQYVSIYMPHLKNFFISEKSREIFFSCFQPHLKTSTVFM